MKLYNILEDIILEERQLLSEHVTYAKIEDALTGEVVGKDVNGKEKRRHFRYRIEYMGEKDTDYTSRSIDIYAMGKTPKGNTLIRAYESKGGSGLGMKTFRVDRIRSFNQMGFVFYPKSQKDTLAYRVKRKEDKGVWGHQLNPLSFADFTDNEWSWNNGDAEGEDKYGKKVYEPEPDKEPEVTRSTPSTYDNEKEPVSTPSRYDD